MLRYPAPGKQYRLVSHDRSWDVLSEFVIRSYIVYTLSHLMPRRDGRKNRSRRYSMKLVGRPKRPLLLPLLNHPGGATLFNFVSDGNIAKSPASSTARPRVKFSSRFSAWTIAWKDLRITCSMIHVYDMIYPRRERFYSDYEFS